MGIGVVVSMETAPRHWGYVHGRRVLGPALMDSGSGAKNLSPGAGNSSMDIGFLAWPY